jgi:aquaporin Z
MQYAVEAIGAFFLLVGVGAVAGSASPFAPLGIGAVLIMMTYAGGQLSGEHYNAVMALAVLVRRRIALRDALAYWIVQFGVGMLAAFVVGLLFTFALCSVVLNVANSKSHPDNPYYGLAVGFTVLAGTFAVGAISGGAFNPVVSLVTAVMDMSAWPTLWVYLVAQTFAGIVAGVSFLALKADDRRVGRAGLSPC